MKRIIVFAAILGAAVVGCKKEYPYTPPSDSNKDIPGYPSAPTLSALSDDMLKAISVDPWDPVKRATKYGQESNVNVKFANMQVNAVAYPDSGIEIRNGEGVVDRVNCVLMVTSAGGWGTFTTGMADGRIVQRSMATGEITRAIGTHSGPVDAIAISCNSALLASASQDKTLRIWKYDLGTEFRRYEMTDSVRTVAFSPDCRKLAYSLNTYPGYKIQVIDIDSGSVLAELQCGNETADYIAFSPDGRLFATSQYNHIRVWETETWTSVREFTTNMSTGPVSFSADGKLLVAPIAYYEVGVFDLTTGSVIARISENATRFLGFFGNNVTVERSNVSPALYRLDDADMTNAKPEGPPYPKASIEMISNGELGIGGTFHLKVTVDNSRGEGDLFGVTAVTECREDWHFDKVPIFFGRVAKGTSMSREMKVPVDASTYWGLHTLKLKFYEDNDYVPPENLQAAFTASGAAAIKDIPLPDFAISVQVFDGQGGRGVGNGDGILQKGESPEISVSVRNNGGKSGKTILSVQDVPQVRGIDVFGDLVQTFKSIEPGGFTAHSFKLAVKPVFADDKISFKVKVSDDRFLVTKEETVQLAIGNKTETGVIAISRQLEVTEEKAPLYTGASKDSSVMGYLRRGDYVVAKAWIGDFYRVDLTEGQTAWIEVSKAKEFEKKIEAKTGKELPTRIEAPRPIVEPDMPPMIAINSPRSGYITDTKRVTIEGSARDDKGVRSMEIKVNGATVAAKDVQAKKEGLYFRSYFSEEISLADGLNKVEVVFTDTKDQKETETIEVSYLGKYPTLKGFYKNVWVTVVGIDKYQDKNIPELKYAVNDAKSVEKLMTEKVVSGKVFALYNEEATRENITRLVGQLAESAEKDDAVLMYFACHGKTFGEAGDLIPYDGTMNANQRFSKNLSMKLFRDEIANSVRAKHLLVVVDACYGGILTRGLRVSERQYRTDEYLKEVRDKEAKMVLTAGSDTEEVLDSGTKDHSVFTGELTAAIESVRDFIGARELYEMTKTKVEEEANRRQHKQTPQFGYWWGDGDFIFIKK